MYIKNINLVNFAINNIWKSIIFPSLTHKGAVWLSNTKESSDISNPESTKCRCIVVQLVPCKNYHKLSGCRKCRLLLCFSLFTLFLL